MRGRRRRDDGWDEGHRDTQDSRRDTWSDGSPSGSGGLGGPGGDWSGSDWPAATGYQSGGNGYQRPAAQAVFPTAFPTAGYPGQGAAGQAPADGAQGYGPQGYGDAAYGAGGGQGPAGFGYGSPGYSGSGSGYPGAGYDASGHGGTQYGGAQYGSAAYGSAGYGDRGGAGGGGPRTAAYGDGGGYGGGFGEPAYGGQGQAGAGYQDPGTGQRGYDAAGYSGSPGYGGGSGYAYGSGSAYDATANTQTSGSAYQGSAGIGAPGRGSGEFQDFAPATAQYGHLSASLEPELGIPEFAETNAVASANGNSAGTPRPYGRLSIFTLLDDKTAEFDRLAERAAEAVRTTEPDTLVYVIHVVPKAPMQRIIYEIYRDRAAFESHERQPHIQRFAADCKACVLATNIIDLRLKYAKVTALGAAQAPQESQAPQSSQAPRETQSTWTPRALESGARAYANSGAAVSGGAAGYGSGYGANGAGNASGFGASGTDGTGGYGTGVYGSADGSSGGRDWPADPERGQYSAAGTGRYPEGVSGQSSESGAWGQRYGGS